MELSDAVNPITADSSEVSHPHRAGTTLIDKRQPREPLVIAGELRSCFVQEPAIDLVNDLQMAGQQATKNFDWPFLQGFGQQGMISIGNCLARYLPRGVPAKLVFIYQQTHQLGDGDSRVRVIQLNGIFFVEVFRPATA